MLAPFIPAGDATYLETEAGWRLWDYWTGIHDEATTEATAAGGTAMQKQIHPLQVISPVLEGKREPADVWGQGL